MRQWVLVKIFQGTVNGVFLCNSEDEAKYAFQRYTGFNWDSLDDEDRSQEFSESEFGETTIIEIERSGGIDVLKTAYQRYQRTHDPRDHEAFTKLCQEVLS